MVMWIKKIKDTNFNHLNHFKLKLYISLVYFSLVFFSLLRKLSFTKSIFPADMAVSLTRLVNVITFESTKG